MRSVFTLGLFEKRFFTLGWLIGLGVLSALIVVFFPSLSSQGALDAMVAGMPKEFEGFIGDLADLRNFSTYLASQLFDIRSSIIVGVLAVLLGVSLGAADESSGRLRTVLSLPISRTSYLLQKLLVLVVVMGVATLGFAGGIYATMPFVEGTDLPHDVLWQLIGMTWLLGVALAAIPFAIGLATGSKGLATIVGVLVIAASYLVSVIGMAVDWIADIEPFTPFYYFSPLEVVKEGISWAHIVVLAGVVVVAVLLALLRFRKRDIA